MTAGDGTIFKTTNAGSSWIELNSTVSTALNSIYFPDSQTGYTVGSNGVILKTTTGGLGLNESSQRKLFSDINSRAKKVSQSLSFKFDERDVVNLLIKDLLKNNNTNTIHGLIIDHKSRIVRPQNKAWMSISRLNRFISYLLLNLFRCVNVF